MPRQVIDDRLGVGRDLAVDHQLFEFLLDPAHLGAGTGLLPWVQVSFFDQTLAPKAALSSWHGVVTTSVFAGSGGTLYGTDVYTA